MLLNSASQGDILTVIRRLDEHWIEARLGDKVGVCPLQFTEVSYPVKSCSFFFPLSPRRVQLRRISGFSLFVFDWSESVAAVLRRLGAKGRCVQQPLRLRLLAVRGDSCASLGVRGADCRLPPYLLPPGVNFSHSRKESDSRCYLGECVTFVSSCLLDKLKIGSLPCKYQPTVGL